MKIDLGALQSGQISYADLIRDIHHTDLYTLTDEIFAEINGLLAQATDAAVLFVPRDSAASDQSEQGWTISHVVAHLTATLEETAAAASMLARGVEVKERLRYETPWQDLTTRQMVLARLQESQRMCNAFLNAWPDKPHLDLTVTRIPAFGPMNAIGLFGLGIGHGQAHLSQLHDTMHQYTLSENL